MKYFGLISILSVLIAHCSSDSSSNEAGPHTPGGESQQTDAGSHCAAWHYDKSFFENQPKKTVYETTHTREGSGPDLVGRDTNVLQVLEDEVLVTQTLVDHITDPEIRTEGTHVVTNPELSCGLQKENEIPDSAIVDLPLPDEGSVNPNQIITVPAGEFEVECVEEEKVEKCRTPYKRGALLIRETKKSFEITVIKVLAEYE